MNVYFIEKFRIHQSVSVSEMFMRLGFFSYPRKCSVVKLLIFGCYAKIRIAPVFFKKNEKSVKLGFHDGLI